MLREWLEAICSVFLLLYFKMSALFASMLLLFLEMLVTYALNSLMEKGEGQFAFDIIPSWLVTDANEAILYLAMAGLTIGIIAMLGYMVYLVLKRNDEWMEIWTAGLYRVMAFQLCMILLFADWAFWAVGVLVLPGNYELVATAIAIAMVPMIALFSWKAIDIMGYIRLEKGHFESVRVI